MTTRYKKAAPKKAKRTNRDHGGVPQLAAKLSGRSIWTVYGVIYRRVKSAHIERCIKKAQHLLTGTKEQAA